MSNRKTRGLFLFMSLSAAAAATLVYACGPFFPMQLLDNRERTLLGAPSNSFAYEAAHLVQVKPGDPIKLPAQGSGSAQAAASPALLAAEQSVDAAVQAANCESGKDCAQAMAASHAVYAHVRDLVVQGTPDPTGLAVASFGDEALLYLRSASTGQQCNWLSFLNSTPCAQAIPAADLKRAIALYAQQAARGSKTGTESLSLIADWALKDSGRTSALIDDPIAQRLLVGYAMASSAADPQLAIMPDMVSDPQLAVLVDAIRARHMTHLDDADLLASLAYKTGRYDLAAALISGQDSALANWVRAKLALRRGDMPAAAQAYAAAAKAFPTSDASVESSNARLIEGERGVLTLSRGQYVEALNLFYDAAQAYNTSADRDSGFGVTYYGDMSYVAERVLTVDELKTFVDAHAPATKAVPYSAVKDYTDIPVTPVADTLRYLLARRLVRDGRIADAMPYFPMDDDVRFASYSYDTGKMSLKPNTYRKWAVQYAEALHTAQNAWFNADRAKGWFKAAVLAKTEGMELMGYEQDPDFVDSEGEFYGDSGRSVYSDANSVDSNQPAPSTTATRTQAMLKGPYITDGEKQRFAASESKPYARYHYRVIAADYAQRAADLLPPRSQAYAAVLCRATLWNINYAPDRAKSFYQEYLQHGAHVDFGGPFGTVCAEPDFHAAKYFRSLQALRYARHHKKRTALAGAIVIAAALAGRWLLYRRRKARPATDL